MSRRILLFVGAAYLITWVAWLPLAGASLGWFDVRPSLYLHLIGGLGPAVAALAMSAVQGRDVVTRLLRRSTLAPLRWVVLAIAMPVALYVAAAGILLTLGYAVNLAATGTSTEYPQLSFGVYGQRAPGARSAPCHGMARKKCARRSARRPASRVVARHVNVCFA